MDMSHDELYVRLHRQCVEVAEQKVYDNAVKVARSNRSPDTILEGADIASAAYDLVNYRTFRELFRHWPDMRRTFVRLVNVPLTTELRKVVWFACLQDPRTAHGKGGR